MKHIKLWWRETPRSVIFWNSLIFITFGIVTLISIQLMYVMMMIMSMFAFGVFVEEMSTSSRKSWEHYWTILAPLTWAILIIGLFIMIGKFILDKIRDFNKYLDGK